jgi:serralysin
LAFDYNKNHFFGGAGNDTLKLGGGNDIGNGDEGNDRLFGELGADILTGGANKDRFVFLAISDSTVAASGRDTITDFSRREKDIIDLELIDANGKKRGNQDFDFIGTDNFSRHAGELRIKASGDGYLIQGDTDGNKKADFAVFVDDFGKLKAGDFDL